MSWQDKLRQVEPYVAGEQPKINNMIKLNTNENPYGPCKQIKDILKEIVLASDKNVKKRKRKVKYPLQVFILSRKIYFGLFIVRLNLKIIILVFRKRIKRD